MDVGIYNIYLYTGKYNYMYMYRNNQVYSELLK